MGPNILSQLNWVDFVIIIFFFRICYIALKNGFPVELFKFLGTIVSVYLALHYYTTISDFLDARLASNILSLDFLDVICFVLLVIIGYLAFVILRMAFLHVVKIEAISLLNRWGGLVLGLARGILWTGLVVYFLTISTIDYINESVKNSYLAKYNIEAPLVIYRGLWNGLCSKFMTQEKLNTNVDIVEESIVKK